MVQSLEAVQIFMTNLSQNPNTECEIGDATDAINTSFCRRKAVSDVQ